jgi:hypothetical protein
MSEGCYANLNFSGKVVYGEKSPKGIRIVVDFLQILRQCKNSPSEFLQVIPSIE